MKRKYKVECDNCGWTGKRTSSSLTKRCPNCKHHHPKRLMAKDRMIVADVIGCPWCDSIPCFAQLIPGRSIVQGECRNDACEAKPSVIGNDLKDCIEKWNVWEKRNNPKDQKGPTKYSLEFPKLKW